MIVQDVITTHSYTIDNQLDLHQFTLPSVRKPELSSQHAVTL